MLSVSLKVPEIQKSTLAMYTSVCMSECVCVCVRVLMILTTHYNRPRLQSKTSGNSAKSLQTSVMWVQIKTCMSEASKANLTCTLYALMTISLFVKEFNH